MDGNDADVIRRYAAHLRNHRRFAESRALAREASELDPLSFFAHFELILIDLMEHRFAAVIHRSNELLSVFPGNPMVAFIKARALVERGAYTEALEVLERLGAARYRRPASTLHAYIMGRTGDESAAMDVLDQLRTPDQERRPTPTAFDEAVILLGMGRTAEALAALEEAIEQRDDRVRLLAVEPLFDGLRGLPEFQRLLSRAGLQP